MAKILLVDDAAFMRMVLKKSLTGGGFADCEFIEAADGAEGVQLFDQELPDVVIMDITMPKMDGLEALKAIRAKHPTANVIMCTAMGQESILAEAIRAGARDFVIKPFEAQRIVETVGSVLNR